MLTARGPVQGPARQQDTLDDIEQDLWLAFAKNPPRQRDSATLRRWVGVVGTRLIDRWRRQVARADDSAAARSAARDPARSDVTASARAKSPDDEVQRSFQRREIVEAVARLPEPYRDAVAAYYFEGCSLREVAAQLETDEALVRTWIHRGRRRIRADLEDRYGRGGERLLGVLGFFSRRRLVRKRRRAPAVALGAGAAAILVMRIVPAPIAQPEPAPTARIALSSVEGLEEAALDVVPANRRARSVIPTPSVRVVSSHTGRPIAGATILAAEFVTPLAAVLEELEASSTADPVDARNLVARALRVASPSARTGEALGKTSFDGTFSPSTTRGDLLATAPGYAPRFVPLRYRAGERGSFPQTIALDAAAPLEVHIVDMEGVAVAGASVSVESTALVRPGVASTLLAREVSERGAPMPVSGADGFVTLPEIPRGASIEVTATSDGLYGRNVVALGRNQRSLTLVTKRLGRIDGVALGDFNTSFVALLECGQPRARARAARIDGSGHFSFSDVLPGRHSLEVRNPAFGPEYACAVATVDVEPGKVSRIHVTTPVSRERLTCDVAGVTQSTLLGRAELFLRGECVARASPVLRESTGRTTVDFFAPPGSYAVRFASPGRPPVVASVEIPGDALLRLPPPTSNPPREGSIAARVFANGVPMFGVLVEALGQGSIPIAQATSTANGEARFRFSAESMTELRATGPRMAISTFFSACEENAVVRDLDVSAPREALVLRGTEVPTDWSIASEWVVGEYVDVRRPSSGCRSRALRASALRPGVAAAVVIISPGRVWVVAAERDEKGVAVVDLDRCALRAVPAKQHLPAPSLFLGRCRPLARAYGPSNVYRSTNPRPRRVFVDALLESTTGLRVTWLDAAGYSGVESVQRSR